MSLKERVVGLATPAAKALSAGSPGKGTRAKKVTRLERDLEKYYLAPQWKLILRKLRRHRIAMVALFVLVVLYGIAAFCEFVAPYGPQDRFGDYVSAPPQVLKFSFENGLYVHPISGAIDRETFERVYVADQSQVVHVRLFTTGESYRMWQVIPANAHLIAPVDGQVFLFGTDDQGRDVFSRVMYGARISLSIGLAGVFLSFVFGLGLGAISGYFGGVVDNVIQRAIDLIISIPTIPFWMALAAALPQEWSITQTYVAITVIMSVVGWCGLARVVRGKLLSLREEDFATAAKVAGASEWRIVSKHLLPLFFSYIIVSLTLSIPAMILGETALSFLGLGMQSPGVSWGVLLQDAQQLVSISEHPWLLIPALFVIVTVLMFNFLGDGLRDAADPYST